MDSLPKRWVSPSIQREYTSRTVLRVSDETRDKPALE